MKHLLLTAISLSIILLLNAQKEKYICLAVYNTQNAMPFGKFSVLFKEILHPGVEVGYGKIFSAKNKHEWVGELKFSYFYHRYVQHGILLYANIGYRYKLGKRLSAEASLGSGYMHSIPTAAKLKLNSDGEYENNKGVGRMQATASFGIGLNYLLIPDVSRPVRLFAIYQQRVQMPFVKSYVPLLPYNSFMIGISRAIKNNSSPK